jgi:hypothetical protein
LDIKLIISDKKNVICSIAGGTSCSIAGGTSCSIAGGTTKKLRY